MTCQSAVFSLCVYHCLVMSPVTPQVYVMKKKKAKAEGAAEEREQVEDDVASAQLVQVASSQRVIDADAAALQLGSLNVKEGG
jgi:flagellar motility protein MotE (MotC chaperone)